MINLLFWRKRHKKFTSDLGWFEMELSANWERYIDEDEAEDGTYAFYDPKNWKGNFRITPLKTGKVIDFSLLDSYFEKGAEKKIIGYHTCAHYKNYVEDNEDNSIIFFWIFFEDDIEFVCSFSTGIELKNTLILDKELTKAEAVIKSINLLLHLS